jgi:hypothetical protein
LVSVIRIPISWRENIRITLSRIPYHVSRWRRNIFNGNDVCMLDNLFDQTHIGVYCNGWCIGICVWCWLLIVYCALVLQYCEM